MYFPIIVAPPPGDTRCRPDGTGGLILRAIVNGYGMQWIPSWMTALKYGSGIVLACVISSTLLNSPRTSSRNLANFRGSLRRKYTVYERAVAVVSVEAALRQ
jgi:hypothetical protein